MLRIVLLAVAVYLALSPSDSWLMRRVPRLPRVPRVRVRLSSPALRKFARYRIGNGIRKSTLLHRLSDMAALADITATSINLALALSDKNENGVIESGDKWETLLQQLDQELLKEKNGQ